LGLGCWLVFPPQTSPVSTPPPSAFPCAVLCAVRTIAAAFALCAPVFRSPSPPTLCRCTILNYSKAYARMGSKHPDLEPIVELVEEPYETFNPRGGFDLVHSCVWRGQFEAQPVRPTLEARLLSYAKPGGTVLMMMHVRGWC
jgi:hypothetical protein